MEEKQDATIFEAARKVVDEWYRDTQMHTFGISQKDLDWLYQMIASRMLYW